MKKLLFGIFTVLLGCIGFSSASSFDFDYIRDVYFLGDVNFYEQYGDSYSGYTLNLVCPDSSFSIYDSSNNFLGHGNSFVFYLDNDTFTLSCDDPDNGCYTFIFGTGSNVLGGGGSSSSDITVFYDYGHSSTSISCNGDNSIYINGMSSLTGIGVFTPFFNISYIDEDNQSLIESYNKDILYLEDGKFKKTYTGDNNRVLSVQEQSNGLVPDVIYSGIDNLPVTVTGESDNVFSNFGNNALELISSNIPGIITLGFILFIILFIIRLFIPKNRR